MLSARRRVAQFYLRIGRVGRAMGELDAIAAVVAAPRGHVKGGSGSGGSEGSEVDGGRGGGSGGGSVSGGSHGAVLCDALMGRCLLVKAKRVDTWTSDTREYNKVRSGGGGGGSTVSREAAIMQTERGRVGPVR